MSDDVPVPVPERARDEEPPVIDLDAPDAVHSIGRACARWGFFQVVNHGVPAHVISDFDDAAARFFALPAAEKRRVKRTETNPRGWFDDELTKRTLDFKQCFDVGAEGDFDIDGHNQWPSAPHDFRAAVEAYYAAVEALALTLAGRIAQALGLPADAFVDDFDPAPTSFLRINYYPVCESGGVRPAPEDWTAAREPDAARDGVLSVNQHTDAGVLTVLRQRSGDPCSLQVLARASQQWVRVHPVPDAFIINIGDVCQMWSNDRFTSPVHRVLASAERERFSAPYFLNPRYASLMEKRTPEDAEDGPARYTPVSWGEFRRRRFLGDYGDSSGAADVQISDFRIPHEPSEAA